MGVVPGGGGAEGLVEESFDEDSSDEEAREASTATITTSPPMQGGLEMVPITDVNGGHSGEAAEAGGADEEEEEGGDEEEQLLNADGQNRRPRVRVNAAEERERERKWLQRQRTLQLQQAQEEQRAAKAQREQQLEPQLGKVVPPGSTEQGVVQGVVVPLGTPPLPAPPMPPPPPTPRQAAQTAPRRMQLVLPHPLRITHCRKCDLLRPPRAHHCSVCQRCIMKVRCVASRCGLAALHGSLCVRRGAALNARVRLATHECHFGHPPPPSTSTSTTTALTCTNSLCRTRSVGCVHTRTDGPPLPLGGQLRRPP